MLLTLAELGARPEGGLVGRSLALRYELDGEVSWMDGRGAGLWGRLEGQNWRSSLLSSWPVVVQLARMLSRRSWTWRFSSSSFFLSQLTLSSCRDVPRFSWREMYFS